MGTVLELLRSFLIVSFQRALEVSIEMSADDSYPTVQLQHLRLQDSLGQQTGYSAYFCFRTTYSSTELEFSNSLLPAVFRDRIIRAAAFCAGVSKMESDVYETAWAAVVKVLHSIFTPVCESVVALLANFDASYSLGIPKRDLVLPLETIRNLAPFPVPLQLMSDSEDDDDDEDVGYLFTPVPRMIEDAAAAFLPSCFPTKVYGNVWLTDGSSEQEEIVAAESEYNLRVWQGYEEGVYVPELYAGVAHSIQSDYLGRRHLESLHWDTILQQIVAWTGTTLDYEDDDRKVGSAAQEETNPGNAREEGADVAGESEEDDDSDEDDDDNDEDDGGNGGEDDGNELVSLDDSTFSFDDSESGNYESDADEYSLWEEGSDDDREHE
jgi:hypothetical protein